MPKCSLSLAINEMQIKTTLRFYVTQVRLAITTKTMTNAGKDAGKKECFHTVGRNVNWYNHYGN
jgi:hypothetical protein